MGTSFALITPSYAPDFELCSLLKESLDKFVKGAYTHYILVDRKDLELFEKLRGPRTELLSVESLLPSWIFRLPFAKRWWFGLRSLPIRNWILQQLVKLSLGEHLKEEAFVFIDSDNALIRPFELGSLVRGGALRLFRVPGGGKIESHYKWHRTAGKLLGIEPKDYFGARYIGNLITWRRQHLIELSSHVERRWQRPFLEVIANCWHLSEYILYGVFISEVLKEQALHNPESESLCLEYWEERPLPPEKSREFLDRLEPQHVAVMLSAKSKMPVERRLQLIGELEARAS